MASAAQSLAGGSRPCQSLVNPSASPSPERTCLGFARRRSGCYATKGTSLCLRSSEIARRPHAARAAMFKEVEKDAHAEDHHLTVENVMSTNLVTVTPSTTIERALEILVEHRITGLPVLNDAGELVGVVSDFDLLAIDAVLGSLDFYPGAGNSSPATSAKALFPEANSSWKAFKEIQKLLHKTKGKSVGEVMTPHPLTVREHTSLDEAARLLLGSKFRRLPVLDKNGKMVGLLTRGNVVKAALLMKKAAEAKSSS